MKRQPFRCGEYRISYELDHAASMVKIYLVGKRGDDEIYKWLQRFLGA